MTGGSGGEQDFLLKHFFSAIASPCPLGLTSCNYYPVSTKNHSSCKEQIRGWLVGFSREVKGPARP